MLAQTVLFFSIFLIYLIDINVPIDLYTYSVLFTFCANSIFFKILSHSLKMFCFMTNVVAFFFFLMLYMSAYFCMFDCMENTRTVWLMLFFLHFCASSHYLISCYQLLGCLLTWGEWGLLLSSLACALYKHWYTLVYKLKCTLLINSL